MDYNFTDIESRWQAFWADNKTFAAQGSNSPKPKYYVLDMFPYPSGAGLHVGHPLGYIASDIVARYKRLQGFNVLHPMGYDSFGLPAEQYAIQTGQHPAVTTETNIARYRQQLDKIGFAYDWDREVRTSDPQYYRWTQWIFMQLFKCWYNNATNKAEYIDGLIAHFSANGTANLNAACTDELTFTAAEWNAKTDKEKQDTLMNYRLAYQSYTMVNWCEALGTVLANDEVVNGVSERGGHPVERKPMRQWSLRITAYAERLLEGLNRIDWSDALKEQQRNWIGRSEGAMVNFKMGEGLSIQVFTTRPDTIFGVSFMVIAPEHELVERITTPEQKAVVDEYVAMAKNRSERERMTEVKRVSGVFTGAYVEHPFTGEDIPVWIGDYVLAGYGTGAVMAVPAGDERDYAFAKHFGLPIPAINEGIDISEAANPTKDAVMINSQFLNGLTGHQAIKRAIEQIEAEGFGKGKVNYRLRDAGYSRQRYWGEPFPVVYDAEGTPHLLDENSLPVELPQVDSYKPSGSGESPLANAPNWVNLPDGFRRETDTMPGYAGSSWYFLRYMDPTNTNAFVGADAVNYWRNVDLYLGGSEHAVGHLLYSRMWNKFLFDLGLVPEDEPFKKLINQGMIQGVSGYIYVAGEKSDFLGEIYTGYNKEITEAGLEIEANNKKGSLQSFFSSDISLKDGQTKENNMYIPSLIPIQYIDKNDNLLINEFIESEFVKNKFRLTNSNDFIFRNSYGYWRLENNELVFKSNDNKELTEEDKKFKIKREVEKMSKSKWNVINPDDIIEEYGADTLRMYEMFLGPLELSKPWNTNGISGVHNFLRKFWRLTHQAETFTISDEAPTKEELKALHKTIKKVQDDIERFSFNTSVSQFMICVNELSDLKCNKRSIIEPLTILLSPFAPHIAEEVWSKLGYSDSIAQATFPAFNADYVVDDAFAYPIQFNGKMKFNVEVPLNISKEEIEQLILADEKVLQQLAGATPKKVIVVPGKIVNIVA